jgi:hypothetical protein
LPDAEGSSREAGVRAARSAAHRTPCPRVRTRRGTVHRVTPSGTPTARPLSREYLACGCWMEGRARRGVLATPGGPIGDPASRGARERALDGAARGPPHRAPGGPLSSRGEGSGARSDGSARATSREEHACPIDTRAVSQRPRRSQHSEREGDDRSEGRTRSVGREHLRALQSCGAVAPAVARVRTLYFVAGAHVSDDRRSVARRVADAWRVVTGPPWARRGAPA